MTFARGLQQSISTARVLFLASFAVCLFAAHLHAARMAEIELKDGSVIQGEVLSSEGGVYQVRSGALGTIRLEESKIRAIRLDPSAPKAKAQERAALPAGDLDAIRSALLSNENSMAMVGALANDSDFQEVLKDEALMRAVAAGDMSTLLASPKFMRLLEKSAVQDIGRELSQ